MNTQKYYNLEKKIKERVPKFEVRFKNESLFMKFIGKIMFFNKTFMTQNATTIGTKVYLPSRREFEQNPERYYYTLAHEGVHVLDYVEHPIIFLLGYLGPQLCAIFSLFSFLAFVNIYFLFFLLALLFLAPIPSPYRTWAELRGYGMSCKVRVWNGEVILQQKLEYYADLFTTPAYYFMCPFKNYVINELMKWANVNNNECLLDKNPIYKDVYYLTHGIF